MRTRKLVSSLALLPLLACAPDDDGGSVFTTGDDGIDDDIGNEGESDESGSSSSDDDSEGDADTTDDDDTNTTGIKLDTLPTDTTADDGPQDEGCDFVDVLFVIDNSVSMGGYQDALGIAFPQFAETLAATLEPGTNLHVGVTSSEMGYASSGTTSINNGMCTFTGDGMPNTAFYVTPDEQNTGKNGAQGRLFDPGGGQHYFDYTVGEDTGPMAAWFADAAAIGTGGSNIEMETAPAGWFVDAANTATNAGFLRDEGAVLVVFFMTDEPDQTPLMIDGMTGGAAMLAKVAQAKAGCGGLECVIGGGFLLESACSEGQPLEEYLNGLSEPPTIAPLPDEDLEPALAAEEMNALLATTLTEAIAAKCEEIEPVG